MLWCLYIRSVWSDYFYVVVVDHILERFFEALWLLLKVSTFNNNSMVTMVIVTVSAAVEKEQNKQ